MAGVIALDRGPQAALALRASKPPARCPPRAAPADRFGPQPPDRLRRYAPPRRLQRPCRRPPITDLRKTVADEVTYRAGRQTDSAKLLEVLEQISCSVRSYSATSPCDDPARFDRRSRDRRSLHRRIAREAEAAETVQRAYELGHDVAAQSLIRVMQDFAYSIEDPPQQTRRDPPDSQ